MPKPNEAECCDEIVEGPSLLGLFLGKECMSLLELPVMGVLWFRLISEEFFTCVASPTIWGRTGVGFVTKTSLTVSGEVTPMVVLITNGVGKGDLAMVTTFCSHNQTRMEASEVLATICQHDLPMPRVSVVRGYTNNQYLLHSTRNLQATLPWCESSPAVHFFHPIPLDCLCLQKLLPYSKTEVLLPCEDGGTGYRTYHLIQGFYGNAPKSHATSPSQFHYQCLYQLPLHN